jgi:hypothetical protein
VSQEAQSNAGEAILRLVKLRGQPYLFGRSLKKEFPFEPVLTRK